MKRIIPYLFVALLALVAGCRAQNPSNPDSEWLFGIWAPELLGKPSLFLTLGYNGDNIYQYRYPNPTPPDQQDSGTFTMDSKNKTILFTNTTTHAKRTVVFELSADFKEFRFYEQDGAPIEVYRKIPTS